MAHPTILVANDDQTYVDLIQDVLTVAGYTSVVWHVGGGAFHRVRDEQPDRAWESTGGAARTAVMTIYCLLT
jgi:hypothetical protein